MDKLLTIGIPTYNRAEMLEENLNAVIASLEGYEDKTELLISDNASSDGTRSVLQRIKERYPYANIILKPENTGSADNFANILKKARGRFVWILSDDDIITDNALGRVTAYLEEHPSISLVHLNNVNFKDKYDRNKTYKPRSGIKEDFCTADKTRFAECIGCNITFISTLIFNKDKIDAVFENVLSATDEYFLQSYAAFLCVAEEGALMGFISYPCVAARDNGEVSYNMYKVFGEMLYKLLEFAWTHCGFDKKQLLKQYIIYWRLTAKWGVIGAKANGYKHMYADFSKFFKYSKDKVSAWFTLYPFLWTPSFVYKIVKKLKK